MTKRFFGQGEQIGGTNYYFTRDHLGSVREMTDGTGVIRARYDYDPYGRTTKVSGDLDADFGFTGHYYHAKSELYLALYRAYDADTGRWISKDPSGESSGLNLYGYCGNNPINNIDPSGLINWGVVGRGIVGLTANLAIVAGGVFISGTGVGIAVAVYGAYQAGANVGNIINGLREAEEGPTGPAQTATQVGMLAANVRPGSRNWERGNIVGETVDVAVTSILGGKVDTRLLTQTVGKAGTILGSVEQVYVPLEEGYQLVKYGVYGDQLLTAWDYLQFVYDEMLDQLEKCKK